MHQLGRVRPGDVVLVLGASGGVGLFAVQLARAAGATVLAHTASLQKAGRLNELGVEAVVCSNPAAVAEATRDRLVSVVLDPLGGDYVSSLISGLAPRARVVTYGVLAGRTTTVDLDVLYGRGIHIIGTSGSTTPPGERATALTSALEAVLSGAVQVDHEVLPLADGPLALARLAERSVVGKLLLRP